MYILVTRFCCFLTEQKEEKEAIKADESSKLQNGENAKEAATAAPVVNVSEEKKKATKQRFMFNIADGGFTGRHTVPTHTQTCLFSLFGLCLLTFSALLCRASLSVAEWGEGGHCHQEDLWDMAPSPWLLASGWNHTVSFPKKEFLVNFGQRVISQRRPGLCIQAI